MRNDYKRTDNPRFLKPNTHTMSTKISAALKQLLSINAHPPSLNHSPAFHHQLKGLLADLNRTAVEKRLSTDSWTIFSTAALVSLNRPSAFEPFWKSLVATSKERELVYQARLVRETALKSISFIGIAKAINALNAFREVIEGSEGEIVARLDEEQARRVPAEAGENTVPKVFARASETWKSIYRPLDEKLRAKLAAAHPDLPVHILHSHYGPLLSDPPTNRGPIGRIGTSLIAIGTLRAAQHLGPQLLSHVYGLRKAAEELPSRPEPSLGAGTDWLTSDDGAQWIISAIDRLSTLVSNCEHHPSPKL